MSAQTSAFRCFVSTRYLVLSLASLRDVVCLDLVFTCSAIHVLQLLLIIAAVQPLLLPCLRLES